MATSDLTISMDRNDGQKDEIGEDIDLFNTNTGIETNASTEISTSAASSDDGGSFEAFLSYVSGVGPPPTPKILEDDDANVERLPPLIIKVAAFVGTADTAHVKQKAKARHFVLRKNNAKISAFFSYLLFIMGSVLFLVLAVEELQWTKMVQEWPEYALLNYSDEIIYNNYRLCLLYFGSEEAVEAAGCGATSANSSSGGRRMRRRMVEVGYYDEFGWEELPKEVQAAFVTLGYTEDIYEDPLGIGLKATSDVSDWADLTSGQQEAAMLVGYDQVLWDEPQTENNHDDVYNALDDDSLIVTESGWWIGTATVLWFSASFCFVLVGFLDLFREKHYFHMLIVLAGVTVCVGAFSLENNDQISAIFDTISSHLFFLEAIKMMFFDEDILDKGAANWMYRLLFSADLMFLIGALFDIVLSTQQHF